MKIHITLNSKPRTLNSEMQLQAKLWYTLACPDLFIWITLLHPCVSYCLIILVVLTLAYDLLLLYPILYCLTLVPFRMYFTMTLLTHLVFCLAWNYKVPVSCIYSTVRILKSSGSNSCASKSRSHSASCTLELFLLLLTSLTSYTKPRPRIPNPHPKYLDYDRR